MSEITFSESNQYFQDSNVLQSDIGFVNTMDIDVYVQTSFSANNDKLTVTGGYISSFNKDHMIDDQFICYHIHKNDGMPLQESIGSIKFSIKDREFLVMNFVQGMIQGTPIIAILMLSLIGLVLPPNIAIIVKYISIIGIVITYLFFAWKILRSLYKAVTAKGIDYSGVNVVYTNNDDILSIHKAQIELIKKMHSNMDVYKGTLYKGDLYLKEIIHEPTWKTMIKEIFIQPKDDIQEIKVKIEQGINFLFSPDFTLSPSETTNVQQTQTAPNQAISS